MADRRGVRGGAVDAAPDDGPGPARCGRLPVPPVPQIDADATVQDFYRDGSPARPPAPGGPAQQQPGPVQQPPGRGRPSRRTRAPPTRPRCGRASTSPPRTTSARPRCASRRARLPAVRRRSWTTRPDARPRSGRASLPRPRTMTTTARCRTKGRRPAATTRPPCSRPSPSAGRRRSRAADGRPLRRPATAHGFPAAPPRPRPRSGPAAGHQAGRPDEQAQGRRWRPRRRRAQEVRHPVDHHRGRAGGGARRRADAGPAVLGRGRQGR